MGTRSFLYLFSIILIFLSFSFRRFRWIFFAFLLKPVFSVFFKVTFLGPVYEQLLCWDEWIYVLFENGTDFAVIAAVSPIIQIKSLVQYSRL